MEKKLNIFIDAGSNKGQSIDAFFKSEECQKYGGKDSWLIYAFEPNLYFEKYFKHRPSSVVYVPMAVWTEACDLPFYINNSNAESQGCSLMIGKTSGDLDKEKPVIVKAFDFSAWIMKNFHDSDNIVIRMDIEGAEYKVLQDMIDKESIKLVKHLIVEFHQHKMNDISIDQHDMLIGCLQSVCSLKLDILNEYH